MAPALVDLVESRSVCVFDGRELIRLDSQAVELAADLVTDAREQLLSRTVKQEQPGFRWGYLLGVEDAAGDSVPPAVGELGLSVRDQIVEPVGHCRQVDFGFSFFKAAEGSPPDASEGVHYRGYHLDTHTGTEPGLELLRVLVNLHEAPRAIRFAPIDRRALAKRGYGVAKDDYRVRALPPGVPDMTVEIPGFDGDVASYLTFWASAVPHVGADTDAGYFLASYEALARF